jgi:hypothetical protein
VLHRLRSPYSKKYFSLRGISAATIAGLRITALSRRISAAERFQSNYNTSPPFLLTSDAIFAGKTVDEIKAAFPRPRTYHPAHENTMTDPRFDFSSSMLTKGLEAHLGNLARVYK